MENVGEKMSGMLKMELKRIKKKNRAPGVFYDFHKIFSFITSQYFPMYVSSLLWNVLHNFYPVYGWKMTLGKVFL